MPITERLLARANSSPNSGQGSNVSPDAPISMVAGYTTSVPDSLNWTSASVQDVKCYWEDSLVSASRWDSDTYYYNSNLGVNVGTRLYRNIGGSYTYPTNPDTGNWIWFSNGVFNSNVNIITVSGSVISAITSINSLPVCGSPTLTPTPTATETPTPTPTETPTPTPTTT